MLKSGSKNHLTVDLRYKDYFNGVNRDGFCSTSSLPSSPCGSAKHVNGIWTDKITKEKILRERKLNSSPRNSPPRSAPQVDISAAIENSGGKKEQSPMIVLSNRLPFVLKRNEKGGLIRKAR